MPVKSSAQRSRSTRQQTRELDVQIDFIEGVVRRDPGYVKALQLLGDTYTKRGRFTEGLGVDERLAQLEPGNPLVFYNLACSYSLTGQCDLAVQALDQAFRLGCRDFAWLARDPDLRQLRKHPLYAQIRATIRQLKTKPV